MRTRATESEKKAVRRFPICCLLYTVGPQEYKVASPGFSGTKSSFRPESVLRKNILGAACGASFFLKNPSSHLIRKLNPALYAEKDEERNGKRHHDSYYNPKVSLHADNRRMQS